ncbi:MAG: hypothetical protein OSA99_00835 [Acidimicrobiales bacterium]|nr:hypothetical protein [Acidimicrobiales bacterium]
MRLVVLACLLIAIAACGSDDGVGDTRAEQARTAALDAGLDDEVADFLATAARGQTATYQATYPGPEEGTQIVVANRSPDRRIDVLDGERIVEMQLVIDGEAVTCTRDADEDAIVACERTDAIVEPLGAFGASTMEQLTGTLATRMEDYTFAIETATVAGTEARCLVTTIREGRERSDLTDTGTLCISAEGALLRVAQGDEVLEASDYTTDIPDGTFVRPDRDGDK